MSGKADTPRYEKEELQSVSFHKGISRSYWITHLWYCPIFLFCAVYGKLSVVLFVCETCHTAKRCVPHQNCAVLVSRDLNPGEQATLGSLKRLWTGLSKAAVRIDSKREKNLSKGHGILWWNQWATENNFYLSKQNTLNNPGKQNLEDNV